MTRRASQLLYAALAGLLGACALTTEVVAPVTYPAQVPVRSFPAIWVASGNFAEDEAIGDALAEYLAQDDELEVRRVDLAELEPARQNGLISSATVVLLVELKLREGIESYWDEEPVRSCGYYGCTTQYESVMVSAPAISGELVLTVYEGPTARVLQRERLRRSFVAEDAAEARESLIALLTEAAMDALDIVERRVRVELYALRSDEGKRAVALAERGDWKGARALLEREKERLGGRTPREQAMVWYDLGMARRFAPGPNGLDQAAYDAARRAFEWAAKTDPNPAHRRALERLAQARKRHVDIEAQERAREHNFRVTGATREAAQKPDAPDAGPASAPEPGAADEHDRAPDVGSAPDAPKASDATP